MKAVRGVVRPRPLSGPRVAVIGAGLMGRWHAHACARAGGRVVAVVDPDLEAAGRLSAAHHHAAIARSLQDVPADLRLQLVHVCSPPETHERAIREAFACGCSALVEKPAAPNAEATARLVAEGIASHLWIEPVHQVLFQRGVEQARGWLREMGVLRLFDYRVCSAGAEDRPDRAGLIADEILPHPLSLLDALLPGGLDAIERWHGVRPSPGELAATAVAGPTIARVLVSMEGRPTRHDLTLVADEGTIAIDLFQGFAWRQRHRAGRTHKMLRPFGASAACVATAVANLAQRSARREWAYPGLASLVARVYASLGDPAARPLGDRHLLAVARSRDEVLRKLQ